jgi:hypothetical protein
MKIIVKKIIENELKLIADSKRWMGEWVLIAVHEKYFLLITFHVNGEVNSADHNSWKTIPNTTHRVIFIMNDTAKVHDIYT